MSRKKKFPSKIWVGEFDQVRDKPVLDDPKIEYAEYTNLSDVWHDANKSTPIVDGAVFEYPIIIYAKLQGVLKVGIVIKPEQFAAITKLSVTKFDEVLWAYVRDLVPKFNK